MSYLEDRVHFTCESGDIDERICSSVVSALSPQPLCLDSLAILSRHRFDSPSAAGSPQKCLLPDLSSASPSATPRSESRLIP